MTQQLDMNWAYLATAIVVDSFLLIVIICYFLKWRKQTIPVLQILSVLLINQLLQALCQMLGYLQSDLNVICSISLIGRTAFTIAANFWVIFIIRLLYLEKLAPGKYVNIPQFVSRNIILTYAPSLIVSVFLLIVININESGSQAHCWRIPKNKQVLDYIIYITCFVLPNLVACIIVSVYLVLYRSLPNFVWNLFLAYPIQSILFSIYFVSVKLYIFFAEEQSPSILELPSLGQSLLSGIYFIVLCHQKKKKQLQDDQMTLKNSVADSFLDSV